MSQCVLHPSLKEKKSSGLKKSNALKPHIITELQWERWPGDTVEDNFGRSGNKVKEKRKIYVSFASFFSR